MGAFSFWICSFSFGTFFSQKQWTFKKNEGAWANKWNWLLHKECSIPVGRLYMREMLFFQIEEGTIKGATFNIFEHSFQISSFGRQPLSDLAWHNVLCDCEMSLKSHFPYIQIIQVNHYPKIGDCRLFTKCILLTWGLKFVLAPDFPLLIITWHVN